MPFESNGPLLISVFVIVALMAGAGIAMRRRIRRAAELLRRQMADQGWDVRACEYRWIRRGPYLFAANAGTVFHITALDAHGGEFHGFASVSAHWDDYASGHIEILWDAVHVGQLYPLAPGAAPGEPAAPAADPDGDATS